MPDSEAAPLDVDASNSPDLPRVAYSPSELAKILGASRAWVYLRLDDGTIPSVHIAGKRFIRAAVVEALLAGDELPRGVV